MFFYASACNKRSERMNTHDKYNNNTITLLYLRMKFWKFQGMM